MQGEPAYNADGLAPVAVDCTSLGARLVRFGGGPRKPRLAAVSRIPRVILERSFFPPFPPSLRSFTIQERNYRDEASVAGARSSVVVVSVRAWLLACSSARGAGHDAYMHAFPPSP
ncbi:hypothetical protein MRX96_033491 [Rhipicephalus microplus]